MDFEKQTIAFLGTGFLASYMLGPILPFCKKIVLWDHDRINQENYENALYPKGMTGQFKVSALARYLQLMSSVPVQPIHNQFTGSGTNNNLLAEVDPDLVIITFDNLHARNYARILCNVLNIPFIQVGITEQYAICDWGDFFPLPQTVQEAKIVVQRMKEVRDVCERIEFRTLGNRIAALAIEAVVYYLTTSQKVGFEVNHLLTRQFRRD